MLARRPQLTEGSMIGSYAVTIRPQLNGGPDRLHLYYSQASVYACALSSQESSRDYCISVPYSFPPRNRKRLRPRQAQLRTPSARGCVRFGHFGGQLNRIPILFSSRSMWNASPPVFHVLHSSPCIHWVADCF